MRVLVHVDLSPPKRLAAAFKKVIAAVERDDLRSADMKKLGAGGKFYRAKLDYDARLLFRFGRSKGSGEVVAFALEIIEKHAYERSRFLRGATVDEAKLDPIGEDALAVTPEELTYVHPSRARFHFVGKPITFDDAQDALYRHPVPLVLVGAAGSGKTAVLLEKLRVLGAAGDVAYVTQSAWLADAARSLYGARAGGDDDEHARDFLSFRAFLESIQVPRGRVVTARDFRELFDRHGRALKFTDAHACFEELRGVIAAEPEGPLSLEAYLALGPRQSLYSSDQRPHIHALFQKYVTWLGEAGLYDTNLVAHAYAPLVVPRYEAIVIDEVQDFTNAELSLLLRASKRAGAFVLSGDAHQIVHPNLFSWSKLKSLFFREEALAKDEIAFLSASYRNARRVTEVANALLKVKWARFGSVDRESNALTRPASDTPGTVAGIVASPSALAELSDKIRGSVRTAIVVLREEHKADASRALRTPLVFSVHEAKGLEYETVILYGMLGQEPAAYRELCAGVAPEDLVRDELDYRRGKDKSDRSLEAYKFFANALYVALTRAVENVVVVETDPKKHPLLDLLGISFVGDASQIAKRTSTAEEWQREARSLELQGKAEQAAAIRSTVLHTEKVPWTVVDGQAYRDLCEKALEKGSIFKKAKDQLLDYAAAHEIAPLARHLYRGGFAEAGLFAVRVTSVRTRALAAYKQKNLRDVLYQCEKYGLEHKSPAGLTPLMLAASAGNAALVTALVERGADRSACDAFGRTAMHHALRRVAWESDPVSIAEIYAAVRLDAIDLQIDGRLVRLYPHQAEYLFFALIVAHFSGEYHGSLGRVIGIDSAFFVDPQRRRGRGGFLSGLPASIVPEFRTARTYVNGVLARSERDSLQTSSRKLWRRVGHGQYAPNLDIAVRYGAGELAGTFRPMADLLGLARIEEHLQHDALGRLLPVTPTTGSS